MVSTKPRQPPSVTFGPSATIARHPARLSAVFGGGAAVATVGIANEEPRRRNAARGVSLDILSSIQHESETRYWRGESMSGGDQLHSARLRQRTRLVVVSVCRPSSEIIKSAAP